jgi:dihydroorotate dehydrogenase electron transfer subunit
MEYVIKWMENHGLPVYVKSVGIMSLLLNQIILNIHVLIIGGIVQIKNVSIIRMENIQEIWKNLIRLSMYKIYPKNIRLPQYTKIIYIKKESNNVKTIFFKLNCIEKIIPGQYFLIYVFNYLKQEEKEWIPISISYVNKINNVFGISIKNIGVTTNALCIHNKDDEIGIMGPFGNGFDVNDIVKYNKIAIIAGGIGIAPIRGLLTTIKDNFINIDLFYGVKDRNQLCFIDYLKNNITNLFLFIDNENKNLIELFEKKIIKCNYDYVISVGPELMMKKILDLCNKYNIKLQVSLERYIKCSRGICGQCVINNKRICIDGPIFNKSILNKLSDFGKYYMNICGEHKLIK